MDGTLLRFVTQATHPPFGHRTGVFSIAYSLRDRSPADAARVQELAGHLQWFEKNLAIPTRFSTSRHPRADATAISWIKAGADGHVRRLRLLVALVDEMSGVGLEELRTNRPGYIVYEDDQQVLALPFADTPR